MNMDLIKRKNLLPESAIDLQKFILIGEEQVKAHKAKIRAIEKTAMGYAAKQAALNDGQTMADLLLEAEARLGEILAIPSLSEKRASSAKKLATLPPTISKKESHIAQTIAKNPDIVETVKAKAKEKGELATTKDVIKAVKQKKKEESKQEKNRIIEVVSGIDGKLHETTKKNPKEGEWWNLGRHKLYCGDTSQDSFTSQLSKCAFAFADPPYNAKAAKWDNNFNWSHDYLSEYAEVVAVTPGIVSIKNFMMITNMPYVWSIAGVITNGMTRGAIGFGNWIYTALFSNKSVYRNSQDVISCAIKTSETQETSHKGRKPFEFLGLLFNKFTEENDTIIDPFLGSGQTLLACEKMDLTCIGGEISTSFCADIIERWENVSHIEAVKNDSIQ